VRNAATTVQNVVTYDAVVDVDNPDLALRPGMTATVTFVYAEREDVLRIPNAALRFRPPAGMPGVAPPAEGGSRGGRNGANGAAANGNAAEARADERMVWVLRAGKPEQVKIRTGVTDGTTTEVLEGALRPGDALLTDAGGAPGSGSAGGGRQGGGGGRGRPPRLF
jgi:HlyD family secretion protein